MHQLFPALLIPIVASLIIGFEIFFSCKSHKRTLANIEENHKKSMKLFSTLGIPPSYTITLPQSAIQYAKINIIINNARPILDVLLGLGASRSMYIKHYLKYADDDPNWKEDFLAFCKKNNIDIDDNDISNGMLLK